MSTVHSFEDKLSQSHAAEDLPIWKEIYTKAFPTMVAMVNHRQDGWHQRAGVDRSLTLANSKQILIDEKTRFAAYDDIALEYVSNNQARTPGWVCKPLMADYIAYAIAPTGKCYLMPVLQLQAAWEKHGDEWRKTYRTISARNPSYETLSLCIEPRTLFRAILGGLYAEFTPVTK